MQLHGDIEIRVLEEKIRFLKLKIAEKQRQICVTQKLLPAKAALDADLAVLQIQVGEWPGDTFSGHWFVIFPVVSMRMQWVLEQKAKPHAVANSQETRDVRRWC